MSETEQVSEGTEPVQGPAELTPLEKLNAEFSAIVPGDISKGAAYIVDHPEEFGYYWGFEMVRGRKEPKDPLLDLRKDAPRIWIKPEQVLLFVKTWGVEILAKTAKGTSIDVNCERIDRDTLLANRSTSNRTLQEKLVTSILLGITVRTGFVKTVVVNQFVANDASTHATAAEALAHNVKLAEAAKTDPAEFLAECVDREWDVDKARKLLSFMTVEQARTFLESGM